MKLNEYDNYLNLASQIQSELTDLFFTTIEKIKEEEELQLKPEVEDPDDLVYQAIEGMENNFAEDEEMILAQEVDDDTVDIVEIDEIDRKNLPRKLQMLKREPKQKVLKTRSVKSKEESFTVVQLDNNVRLVSA